MWFNTTKRITNFLSLKSSIKTTQNTKPKQTRKALSLFCKLISPEEIRESKSEQRRWYSFIADPNNREMLTEDPQPAQTVLSTGFLWLRGEGKMRPSSYMKTGFQIPTHCFHTAEWLLVSKIWDPEKLCLLAELLPFFFFLRQSWNFQPESKISLQSL